MNTHRLVKRFTWLIIFICILAGCAAYTQYQLDSEYGYEQVRSRNMKDISIVPEFHRDIKPIIDNRCVVCHGCYDAPCQLKMEALEGIDRGASKNKVYDGKRLLADNLSRLFIDASSTRQWREKGFYPVLNEREQIATANLQGGVLFRMLQLKRKHPLPNVKVLPDSFDLRLHRDQQCPTVDEFDSFEKEYPLWGMPYAMPGLKEKEFLTIKQWVAMGAKSNPIPPLSPYYLKLVGDWETFLNGESNQQRLMSRYIYEHLFTANLYFESNLDGVEFFKLQRSSTPPGEPVSIIATRRPYDDPGVDRVYYRLVRVKSTLTAKTHMPYLLDGAKKRLWYELFLLVDFNIAVLPSYQPEIAANPFVAFKDIPVVSRYKFMLDEAQFTIMSFIKGPVCRGQVAINVINDHFWVLFANPNSINFQAAAEFLAQEKEHLRLPSEQQSNVFPMENWHRYSSIHKKYLQAKRKHLDKLFPSNKDITLDLVWDGDAKNSNATLTVFRHFDSASVIRGLYGNTPKTAWLIDYPLLERIHYLLVAGFDVYGNIGHQLETRLYMDFLRMEGEYNLLALLPKADREREITHWYRGAESKVKKYVESMRTRDTATLGIKYETSNTKQELFDRLKKKLGSNVISTDRLNGSINKDTSSSLVNQLNTIALITGESLNYMPELSIMKVGSSIEPGNVYSIIVNRAHSNVSGLFGESNRLIPAEQTVTIVEGIVGAYPNVFFKVTENKLADFATRVKMLNSKKDYEILLDLYAVRRTSGEFWDFSDWLHHYYRRSKPIEAALLDYNRIENR